MKNWRSLAKRYKGKIVVYKLTWEGRSYIGSSEDLECRLSFWYSDFNLWGLSSGDIKWEVLMEVTPETRYEAEKAMIAYHRTLRPNGHNKNPHGRAGHFQHKFSDETRERMSKAHLGWKPSEETKIKMGAANVGRKHSPEHIAKCNEGRRLARLKKAQKC